MASRYPFFSFASFSYFSPSCSALYIKLLYPFLYFCVNTISNYGSLLHSLYKASGQETEQMNLLFPARSISYDAMFRLMYGELQARFSSVQTVLYKAVHIIPSLPGQAQDCCPAGSYNLSGPEHRLLFPSPPGRQPDNGQLHESLSHHDSLKYSLWH